MTAVPLVCPIGQGSALYYPATDRLLVLNTTGTMVWEMLNEGYGRDEIALMFAGQFRLSHEQALHDVSEVFAELNDPSLQGVNNCQKIVNSSIGSGSIGTPANEEGNSEDCGVYGFGQDQVRIISSVGEVDCSFFSRFQHRASGNVCGADSLEVFKSRCGGYRLKFREILIEETTVDRMMSRLTQVLLSLEHPNTTFLAYCHAAAVTRGSQSVLMPGSSGVGKSTLTAFLVAQGFVYLGDDIVAIGEVGDALLPLPTCLSVKSGSWLTLQKFFPILPQLPTLSRYGRLIRYVEPQNNYEVRAVGPAPCAVVFPAYSVGQPTRLTPLTPIQTMIRLLGAHVAFLAPATREKLEKFIRFVEQTPAYELTYSELPSALTAIEDLL